MKVLLLCAMVALASAAATKKTRQERHYSPFMHSFSSPYSSYMTGTPSNQFNRLMPFNSFGGGYNTGFYNKQQSYNPYSMSMMHGSNLRTSPYMGAQQVFDRQLTAAIQTALNAAGIDIPEGHIVVIHGKTPETPVVSTGNTGVTGSVGSSGHVSIPTNVGQTPVEQVFQQLISSKPAGASGRPYTDVPNEVPKEVISVLPQANLVVGGVQNFVKPNTVVSDLFGKNPSSKDVCDQTPDAKQCIPCGVSNGQPTCITVSNLASKNPFVSTANNAFQEGMSQLEDQLAGRHPVSSDKQSDDAYYWVYRIYYHVSDYDARLWMGHVQLYMAAYEWTLGLYYYIDPNGDLRLMYYSSTPEDGYVAEEAIWPNFIPYEWYYYEDGAKSFRKSFRPAIINKKHM